MEKAWQDTGMLTETVLHAHAHGRCYRRNSSTSQQQKQVLLQLLFWLPWRNPISLQVWLKQERNPQLKFFLQGWLLYLLPPSIAMKKKPTPAAAAAAATHTGIISAAAAKKQLLLEGATLPAATPQESTPLLSSQPPVINSSVASPSNVPVFLSGDK